MTRERKKNRRSDSKYPALDPDLNLVTRRDEISDLASYAKTLSPEDRAWLNAYAEEEICANFNHKGPKVNDPNDSEARKRVYNRNNARNRCIHTREAAQDSLNYLEDMRIAEQCEEDKEEEENDWGQEDS